MNAKQHRAADNGSAYRRMPRLRVPALAAGLVAAWLIAGTFRADAQSVQRPLGFIANTGQWNAAALYRASAGPITTWLTARDVWIDVAAANGAGHAVRQRVAGARLVRPEPESTPFGHWTFIRRGERFYTSAAASVRYRDLVPGVDLRYHFDRGNLEYDILVRPGADPSSIDLLYDGASSLHIASDGALEIGTSAGVVRMARPVCYQLIGTSRIEREGRYRIEGDTVRFDIASYDVRSDLVIDPAISLASYFGGTGIDEGKGLALDGANNIVIGGSTLSNDLPTTPGAYSRQHDRFGSRDLFVARFDPTGSVLLWGTYLGGTGDDDLAALRLAQDGSVVIAGTTTSQDFPTTASSIQPAPAGGSDGFIAVLSPDGARLRAATYYGGSGDDHIEDLAVNLAGQAFVVGWTTSDSLPTTPSTPSPNRIGGEDAFVARLNAALDTLRYGTYLGGTGDDRARAIAIGIGGAANITGWTVSGDFPTTPAALQRSSGGGRDAFVMRLRFNGTVIEYSTYYGGSDQDQPLDIAIDSVGNQYIAGLTLSRDLPITTPDAPGTWFVARIDSATGALGYGRYIGPAQNEFARSIEVSRTGEAYIAGGSDTRAFPTTADAVPAGPLGGVDVAVVRLSADGTRLVHANLFGGEGDDLPSSSSVLTRFGDLYLVGTTSSARFPVSPRAFDTLLNLDGTGRATDAFFLAYRFLQRPEIATEVRRTFDTLRCDSVALDTFDVRNSGDAELVIGANRIQFNNGRFTLIEPDPRLVDLRVPPGGSRRYIVRFFADRPGYAFDTLLIFSNDSLRSPLRIALSGVRSMPFFPTLPTSVVLPRIVACGGGTSEKSFGIDNAGNMSAVLEPPRFARGGPFSVTRPIGFPVRIDTAARLSFTVRFAPTRAGMFVDTLLIPVGGCGNVLRIPVSGIADSVSFDILEERVDFPPLASCTGSIDTTITLANTGTSGITVGLGVAPGNGFTIVDALPVALQPGERRALRLRFGPPSGPVSARAVLTLSGDPCERVDSVELRGDRRPSAALEAPSEVLFGAIGACVGASVDSVMNITVRNASPSVVRILTPAVGSPFSVDAAGFPVDLAEGASTSIVVHYRPDIVRSDASQLVIPLSAGGCPDTLRIHVAGSRGVPLLAPVDTLLEVGVLPECRADDTVAVVLRNTTTVPATIDSIDAVDGAEHLAPAPTFTVAPGDSVVVWIRFAPRSAGSTIGTVRYFTAGCRDSAVVRVHGTKVGAVLAWEPASITVPQMLECMVDTVIPLAAILHNRGSSDYSVSVRQARIVGASAFRITLDPSGSVIRGGDSLSVAIEFAPAAVGTYDAILEIVIDPCDDTLRLPLAGSIIRAVVEISGGDFGTVRTGSTSRAVIVVRNPLPVAVVLDSVPLPPPFVRVGGTVLPQTIAPGDSVEIEIEFAPQFSGSYAPSIRAFVGQPCSFSTVGTLMAQALPAVDTFQLCISGREAGIAGDTIDVVLTAAPASALESTTTVDYLIRYEWRRLQYLPPSDGSVQLIDRGIDDGLLHLRQTGATQIEPRQLVLRFRLLSGTEPTTTVRFDSAWSASGELLLAACTDSLVVRISERCVLTNVALGKYPNRMQPIRPNPADGTIIIEYQQLEDARAIVTLHDMNGREVLRALDQELPGGSYLLRVDVADIPVGTYFVRVRAGEYSGVREVRVER